MRGLKSTIAMAVVLAGLGAYIYFVEWKRPADAGAETKDKAFAGVEAEKIEGGQIKAAGGETSRLVKNAGGWQVVEPIKADADSSEISAVTSNISSLEVQRV